MLPHLLQPQCTEKLLDDSSEFEMYSVKFVLSVASKHAQDKIERQRNRSPKIGVQGLDSPALVDLAALNTRRGWQSD
jgi:uncharacterized protein (DUF1778 family)